MMLKRFLLFSMVITWVAGCHNSGQPDISGIKVELTTKRFENDFFKLDTNNLLPGLSVLGNKYPAFTGHFLDTILNVDPRWNKDTFTSYINNFIKAYYPVKDTASIVFRDFSLYQKEIENALQHVKYYFPNYSIPHSIITYIGPLDGLGDILAEDGFYIGLQVHLTQNYSLYSSDYVSLTYPPYISRKFTPEYISINCMQNVINDLYPEKYEDKSLVVQMVVKGRQLYLLSKFLPQKEEYLLIGYTKTQLKDCYENEKVIWDLFIQNNLLQSIDNDVVSHYIGESPTTAELGTASPGNIGAFTGWQVVKKYMNENSKTLKDLMEEDPEIIFEKAKYKP